MNGTRTDAGAGAGTGSRPGRGRFLVRSVILEARQRQMARYRRRTAPAVIAGVVVVVLLIAGLGGDRRDVGTFGLSGRRAGRARSRRSSAGARPSGPVLHPGRRCGRPTGHAARPARRPMRRRPAQYALRRNWEGRSRSASCPTTLRWEGWPRRRVMRRHASGCSRSPFRAGAASCWARRAPALGLHGARVQVVPGSPNGWTVRMDLSSGASARLDQVAQRLFPHLSGHRRRREGGGQSAGGAGAGTVQLPRRAARPGRQHDRRPQRPPGARARAALGR